MEISTFWDITPCRPLMFRMNMLRPFQGGRPGQARSRCESCDWRLLGLFFDFEDGGDIFLRIVCWPSMQYKAFCPRRQGCSAWTMFENTVTMPGKCLDLQRLSGDCKILRNVAHHSFTRHVTLLLKWNEDIWVELHVHRAWRRGKKHANW
jgi:hypothetical protein